MKGLLSIALFLLGTLPVFTQGFEGELRRIGKTSQPLLPSTKLQEGDLINVKKGSFSFNMKGTQVELGESTLVGIGQKSEYLEIYRGSANVSTSHQDFILLSGTSQLKVTPESTVYWAAMGDEIHISLHRGTGHLLTSSEGKVLKPGQGVMIRGERILSNILALDLGDGPPPMQAQDVHKIFEDTPHFGERYKSIGILENILFVNPKDVIFHYLDALKRSSWIFHVQKGKAHLLAQEILLRENTEVIFPKELQKHLERNPITIALFKDFARLDEGVKDMEEADRVFITFFVRQAMAEELIAKKELRDSLSGFYRAETFHQSNVTESPDESNTPTDQQGASLSQQFRLKWVGLTRSWGRPSVSMRVSDRSFFDRDFISREASTLEFSTKVNRTIGQQGDRVLEVNPSYKVRFDFVNSPSGRDLNFFTHSPEVEVVFTPIQEGGKWSDLFFHVWKAGIDYRQYASGFRFTSTGLQKDVTTFSTSWLGINAIRWLGFRVQESLSINLRSSTSEDPILEYDLLNMDLSVSVRNDIWEAKPLLAIRYRDQPDFRGQERKDLKHEIGLQTTLYQIGNWADCSFGYKYISQTSNQEVFFDYIDHQWSMSLLKAF